MLTPCKSLLGFSYAISHLILGIRYYECPHFSGAAIEAQRDMNPGCLAPESITLVPKL